MYIWKHCIIKTQCHHKCHMFIHSYIIYTTYSSGSQGSWSQCLLISAERWDTPWASRQSIARLTQRRTTVHTYILTYGQFIVVSWCNLHACGLWEKTRGNTQAQGEIVNSTQKSNLKFDSVVPVYISKQQLVWKLHHLAFWWMSDLIVTPLDQSYSIQLAIQLPMK